MAATCPLNVAVRIRPPQPHDGRRGEPSVRALDDTHIEAACEGRSKHFVFDRAFGPEATQQEVYSYCAMPLIDAVLAGTNACIFAFGCTGAGKTHSMIGPEGGRRRGSQDGVLPRAASELFRRIARLEADARAAIGSGGFSAHEVRASFLEVYCENTFDLLGGSVSASREPATACALRETADGRVYAEGAREDKVKSCEQLLDLVASGANARATAATGVHAHSSRSHALLVIAVEHRWRDVGEPDPQKFHSQVARLTLVDLAGAESMERSHGGSVDAAGVGTNMGLLVLGRVISALAKGGERVPYRDSSLTRLMQSCLGGSAVTQMLACVSPVAHEEYITLQTLGYATSARNVMLRPRAAEVIVEIDSDPMLLDVEDEDSELNRRCIWIETADFGDVFARCVGDPADPLILYAHGSGPRNSSMFWNSLVTDVSSLAATTGGSSYPRSFYHVAIDCPGYGRSPGDRQIIRSYPGALISNVARALGRKSIAMLVGSSQGACATFNCALECPKLAHTLAVCHPVGHAPHRYTAISQPSLMIFDTEDDGHPVSVGRQMRRYIPNPHYFEFTRSQDGNWECSHMGEQMLAMMADSWQTWKNKRAGGRRVTELPELTRVAGGFKGWSESHNGEWPAWAGYDEGDAEGSGPASTDQVWRAVLDTSSNCIAYQHVQSGRMSKIRPPGATVLVERLGDGAPSARVPSSTRATALFEGANEDDDEDDEERQEREEREAAAKLDEEARQTQCDLCRLPLVEPVRLARCRCALCGCCAEATVRYTRHCPVCGDAVAVSGGKASSEASEELLSQVAARVAACDDAQIEMQLTLLQQLKAARKTTGRMLLEYGNVSSGHASKRSYTTFLKVIFAEGCLADKDCVAKVDFNINPGYSKPTATAKEPADKKLGFAFEYAMARQYPCFMTVHFRPDLGMPKLNIEFCVQDEAKTARRILLDLPSARIAEKEMTLDADPPTNAWINFSGGRSVVSSSHSEFATAAASAASSSGTAEAAPAARRPSPAKAAAPSRAASGSRGRLSRS